MQSPVPSHTEHLASRPLLVDEEEQLAAQRITHEALFHEPIQAVIPFAEIDCLGVREDAHRPTRAEDHPSFASSVVASSSVTPSTRYPDGDTTLTVRSSSTTWTRRRSSSIVLRTPCAYRRHVHAETLRDRGPRRSHAPLRNTPRDRALPDRERISLPRPAFHSRQRSPQRIRLRHRDSFAEGEQTTGLCGHQDGAARDVTIGRYPGQAACCDASYCAGLCYPMTGRCTCNGNTSEGCVWPAICCSDPPGCIGVEACNNW